MSKRNPSNGKNLFKVLLIVITTILSVFLAWLLYYIATKIDAGDYSEAFAGSIGAIATIISAILVAYQLNAEKRINCSQMLSDLNFRFIENERLMKLYRELENAYKNKGYHLVIDNNDPDKVHDEDLMGYLTFYETLNEYIDRGVLSIDQMNDLFGDRFFKLIHNIDIQEKELYSEPSSYVNIFNIYGKWIKFRRKCEGKGMGRLSVRPDLAIPDIYVREKTYLKETTRIIIPEQIVELNGKSLTYRKLFPKDYEQCKALQDKIIEGLEDKTLFVPTTDDEFYESYLIDYACGLFDEDKLVAVSIFVMNRETPRNLFSYIKKDAAFKDVLTFDTVQVDPNYRGLGIQKFYLDEAKRIAKENNIKYISATVSPNNIASKTNFFKDGFESIDLVKKYNGLDREIVLMEVK